MKRSKIRSSAQGQHCSIRLFPYCLLSPETVVLAHLPSIDKGMGNKSPDWWAAYACAACHDLIDGRVRQPDVTKADIDQAKLRGLYLTHKALIAQGLLTVA